MVSKNLPGFLSSYSGEVFCHNKNKAKWYSKANTTAPAQTHRGTFAGRGAGSRGLRIGVSFRSSRAAPAGPGGGSPAAPRATAGAGRAGRA